MKPVNLHLVSWDRPRMTQLVIDTIRRNTKREHYNLYVLDNGSSRDTVNMLKHAQLAGLVDGLTLCEKNFGLEFARQELFSHHKEGKYFIDVDNDCLPPPPDKDGRDWVERLVDLMETYPEYAAIACRTQVMIGTGNIFELTDMRKDELTDFPHPGGSLRIMRRAAVEKVGGWSRESAGRGSEERYIGSLLHDAGYLTAFATNVKTLHLFGTRGSNNGTDRWGYDKQMKPEQTGHSDIWHPALQNGDDYEEVVKYAGESLARRYFNVDGRD